MFHDKQGEGDIELVKKIALYALAATLLLVSTYGYIVFMEQRKIESPVTSTIMPTRLLNAGEVIDSTMLRHVTVPLDAHRKDAIVDVNSLIGMTVIVPIGSTEEFVSWKLAKANHVPVDGERYYAFPTDSLTNVSNMVRKGDRVDVWIEFPEPVLVEMGDNLWHFSAVKIIENLYVAHVKSSEGIEITDTTADSLAFIAGDDLQLASHRNNSNGIPGQNIYIMTDEIYDAYVMGSLSGTIKLSLPNLNSYSLDSSSVTDVFQQLKSSAVFNREFGDNVIRLGKINSENIQGHVVTPEIDSMSGMSQEE